MWMRPSRSYPGVIVAALASFPSSAQTPSPPPAPHPQWVAFGAASSPDFYVILPGSDDVFLRNQGAGRFVDATAEAGLAELRSLAVAHADFDGDGVVDLLRVDVDRTLRLHRAGAQGTFEDVTELVGLGASAARSARWADVDADGLPDLVVEVPDAAPRLYRNREGLAFEALELPLPAWRDAGAVVAPLEAPLAGVPAGASGDVPAEDDRADRGGGSDAHVVTRTGHPGRVRVGPVSGSGGLGGPGAPGPGIACLPTIRDQATGNCIGAASVPTLGSLFPLSHELNVDAATGFVGMGTILPAERLHVVGNARVTGDVQAVGELQASGSVRAGNEVYADYGDSSTPTLRFGSGVESSGLSSPNVETVGVITSATERLRVEPNGFVGIGTSTPSHKLVVSDPGDVAIVIDGDSDVIGANDHPLLRLQQNGGNVKFNLTFRDGSHDLLLESPDGFEQHFKIFDNAAANDWEFQNFSDVEARITDLGDLQLDGNVSSPAADLAEYYPLGEGVEPGDVVAFRGEGLELFLAGPADRARVAGIVSSKPGLVLGITGTDETSEAVPAPPIPDAERYLGSAPELRVDRLVLHEIEVNGRAPLALSGRVPCKVSAENGSIRAGDPLTVSATPGHAMKATGPGAVIGTALQSLDSGRGTIVVLANLGWYAPGDGDLEALAQEVRSLSASLRALEDRLDGASKR